MTAEGKISNYEKMKDDAAAAFLRFDQEEMIRKFALEHDKMYLYICFAGKRYRISRTTGAVSRSDAPFQPGSYNEVMTIYDVLCLAPESAELQQVFFDMGMHCLGCPISRGETVEEAAAAHGNDVNELVDKLNAVLGE